MQVTKGTWRMREQCVPGSLSSAHAQEPGNEARQNYEYTVAKQNGVGAEWVELFITLTKGMGNQRMDFSCLSSCPGVRGLFNTYCIEGSSLDTCWILGACSAATLSR